MRVTEEMIKENGSYEDFIKRRLLLVSLEDSKKKFYRPIVISDDLLKKYRGNKVKVMLRDDWEEYSRCPFCGEYIFLKNHRVVGLTKFDSNGEEFFIKNLEPMVNKLTCRCGVNIYIEKEGIYE